MHCGIMPDAPQGPAAWGNGRQGEGADETWGPGDIDQSEGGLSDGEVIEGNQNARGQGLRHRGSWYDGSDGSYGDGKNPKDMVGKGRWRGVMGSGNQTKRPPSDVPSGRREKKNKHNRS